MEIISSTYGLRELRRDSNIAMRGYRIRQSVRACFPALFTHSTNV